MRPSNLFLLSLVLALCGCRPQERTVAVSGIETFGLVESPVDHSALESAIRDANLILGTDASVRFTAGWKSSEDASVVRVFAAAREGLGDTELITSFHQCNCVIVQVGRMSAWLSQQTGSGDLLAIDLQGLLAYMLLHEMGHIIHGDVVKGEATSESAVAPTTFNLDATAQKERESAADHYAAQAIAGAEKEKGTLRGLAAANMAVQLAQLSWDLARHRLLDNFGGTAVHAPSLFFDAGLSHPNLEWRILSVNAAISDTQVARQLLHDFESSRQPQSFVLYRSESH